MADEAPLIFVRKLGGLFPANRTAEQALSALAYASPVKIKITKSQGNNRRLALYWAVIDLAVENLDEKVPGLNSKLLHRILKDRAGLYREVTLPSGAVEKDYDSIDFASMPENERAAFIDFAFRTLASWLGCTVQELTDNGREAA